MNNQSIKMELSKEVVYQIREALSFHIINILERVIFDYPSLDIDGITIQEAYDKEKDPNIKEALMEAVKLEKLVERFNEILD